MKETKYNRITVYYSLWGEQFYPSKLKLDGDVEIVNANDPGDMGPIGKFRNIPTPYGACDVQCLLNENEIIYMANHLKRNHNLLLEAQASHIVYWIVWRGIQGNMELNVKEIAALAEMNIPVAMDYIFMGDDE